MADTRRSVDMSTKLQRIAEAAKRNPEGTFTSLNHLLDLELLRASFFRLAKDSAPGADGVTWREYAEDLEARLPGLLDRAKSGRYRAPPVRRVHIPKGTGPETRPIGIPEIEDKLLQRAVATILEAIYEADFHPDSYGFRPGRSAHQAVNKARDELMALGGGWVLEVDVRKFFDTVDHGHLRDLIGRRVQDGVIVRLIGKWLNAGVLEEGRVSYPDRGTPQGGVISPLLANVYLHYVLDQWWEADVKPRLKGRAHLVRYADDFVLLFEHESDAKRVQEVLPKRFAKYGLTVHPEKTRLVPFRRPGRGGPPPGTFDLLGFTFRWGISRRGREIITLRTAKDRFRRGLQRIAVWCRTNRHLRLPVQHKALCQRLRGHYAYFGLTGNGRALKAFHDEVKSTWRQWLRRRSQRARRQGWAWFQRVHDRYPLTYPRVVHSIYRKAAKA